MPRLRQLSHASTRLAATSVTARISPAATELSPAFMEFCTALDSTSNNTRSSEVSCPIWRLPESRSSTSRLP
ncbi:hypothetical protein OMK73_27295 [Cupriavidus sp. D39]|nr:hypothetical protein [Cupriavidus sp. D39]MCY0856970.1 hypothetical protein [Cupriavidus sp. D39]